MSLRLHLPRPRIAKPRFTPATGIAIAALVIAGAGPAHAVAQRIGDGSISTRHLKNYAVTGSKLHSNSVSGTKVVNGTIGTADLSSNARKPQSVGKNYGDSVNIPASSGWTQVLSMRVPAGTWTLLAKGIIYNYDSAVTCDLMMGERTVDRTNAYTNVSGGQFAWGDTPMTLISMRETTKASIAVALYCKADRNVPNVRDIKLVAIATRA